MSAKTEQDLESVVIFFDSGVFLLRKFGKISFFSVVGIRA